MPRRRGAPAVALAVSLGLCLWASGVARAEAPPERTPVRPTEAALFGGLWSSSSAYQGGRSGALFAAVDAEGRYLWRVLAAEAAVVGTFPTAGNGPGWGVSASLRLGVSTPRFSVTAGALASFAPTPAPVHWLPSVSASVRLGPVTPYLGVFDRFGETPARLGVEWRDFGAGWVFPLGGELFGRLWLAHGLGLEARVMAFALFGSLTVVAAVGPVFRPEGAP